MTELYATKVAIHGQNQLSVSVNMCVQNNYTPRVKKKQDTLLMLILREILINFQNSFTARLSTKFAIK